MIITTARKPSSRTRTFCKHLGKFTGWKYVTRGKTGLFAFGDETFLLVGEYKGNPGSFNFFVRGDCVFSIRAAVSLDKEIISGNEPIIHGNNPLALNLCRITGLKTGIDSRRIIRINDNIIFESDGKPYIVLKILESRGEGSAGLI